MALPASVSCRAALLAIAVAAGGCAGTSHVVGADAGPATDTAVASDAFAGLADAPESADVGGRPDARRTPDAYVEPDAGPAPSFQSIYESILVPRCARCHISDAATVAAYRPRLTDVDTAYAQLFDVPVESPWIPLCRGSETAYFRVRAFDPDTSMLAFLPECYVRDADHGVLTEDELAAIRAWILAGAPREPF